jgi:hypothetical protein
MAPPSPYSQSNFSSIEEIEMKPSRKVNTTTYGSPENNSRRFVSPPSYEAPEAKTPDPNVSATTYGNIPRINDQAVYGQTKPTAEQAAGVFQRRSQNTIYQPGAGSSENPPAGQYHPNPFPNPYSAPYRPPVVPKLQTNTDGLTDSQLDSIGLENQKANGVGHDKLGNPRAEDQTNIDPRQQSPAKIPNDRGRSGSSGVFRTNTGSNRMIDAQRMMNEDYDPALGPSSVREDRQSPQAGGKVQMEGKEELEDWMRSIGARIQGPRVLPKGSKPLPIRKNLMSSYIGPTKEQPFQLTKDAPKSSSLRKTLKMLGTEKLVK